MEEKKEVPREVIQENELQVEIVEEEVPKVCFSEKQLQKLQRLTQGQAHFAKKLAETAEGTSQLVKKRVQQLKQVQNQVRPKVTGISKSLIPELVDKTVRTNVNQGIEKSIVYFSNSQSTAISKLGIKILAKVDAIERATEEEYLAEAAQRAKVREEETKASMGAIEASLNASC